MPTAGAAESVETENWIKASETVNDRPAPAVGTGALFGVDGLHGITAPSRKAVSSASGGSVKSEASVGQMARRMGCANGRRTRGEAGAVPGQKS